MKSSPHRPTYRCNSLHCCHSEAKKSSDGDGDDEEKGDDEGGDGDEDGGDGTRKSSPKKSMLSRFKRGRKGE